MTLVSKSPDNRFRIEITESELFLLKHALNLAESVSFLSNQHKPEQFDSPIQVMNFCRHVGNKWDGQEWVANKQS